MTKQQADTAYQFITKHNVLALLESIGKDIAGKANPGYWSYEDRDRAKSYEPTLAACRAAYSAIRGGADPIKALAPLTKSGCQANYIGLIISGLKGEWERDAEWLKKLPGGYHWVTYKGDFFGINAGDHLNRPSVKRIANEYAEAKDTTLSEEIAGMIPNPCTRVKMPPQAL